MAMDALKNLSNNVPGWLKQLDDLSGQIDLRQAELAAVAAAEGKNPETKSLRNKGSTESLRPKDDVPIPPAPKATPDDTILKDTPTATTEASTPPTEVKKEQVAASPPSPSALKQSQEAIKAARAMLSAEGAPAAYRTRTMILVYYDSYVQRFFDNLVRFVSSSRNFIRKAKMAAKITQVKRSAKMDMSEGNEDGDDDPLPSLRYMSTRRGYGPAGANDQPPDVYDRLDKSLEIVQSMCEHGAHQFLRDGDCNDEISKVQKQLTEVLEVATKEMERIQREEPELAKETSELGKIRTRRPITMLRNEFPGSKDGSPLTPNKGDPEKLEAAKPEDRSPHLLDAEAPLEVDPNIIEADEGIDVAMEVPKLQYR
ncbi:hypothetical protein EDB81DRAFT_862457 [Dactylonectria macrodidyma]|uniref:Uncharacterized protein n=1 Tax=Dactylonectria macrodidyma TaxID=307937 RepID=A0A9P9D7D4_9HYPO|nr:hypothetical protein EDB81DRAFT_862457 [Dactylonectria macrodidyma]